MAVALAFGVPDAAAPATSGEASFEVAVPAGGWKGVRLRRIPARTELAARVESDGPIAVALLDAAQYAAFPASTSAVFRGRTDGRFNFAVKAPTASDYYLLLDNREGAGPRSVKATVRAQVAGAARERDPEPEPRAGEVDGSGSSDAAAADEKLARFREQLAQIFVFEPFPIEMRSCGRPRAFASESGVVLCREYAAALYQRLGDRQKAGDALSFALFHELGHVLLRQWRQPLYDNEDAADEFATALLALVGQADRARAQADYLEANASVIEALAAAFADDRHPLSAQRARNIRRWADDRELLSRWQTVLVPHMQTAVLERLRAAPAAWTDLALVERELRGRRSAPEIR